jgi:hypothetical protein
MIFFRCAGLHHFYDASHTPIADFLPAKTCTGSPLKMAQDRVWRILAHKKQAIKV